MMRALAATVLLTSLAFPAMAADNGIYVGGSIGQANVEVDDQDFGFDLDDDDTGFKGIVGIRPLDFLGFELNYVDFGSQEQDVGGFDFAFDATGLDAFVVGFLPLPFVDLFAKAGFIAWDADVSVAGFGNIGDDSGEDLAYGVGVQAHFGSIGVRAEYEMFEIDNTEDVNLLSLGVTWTFL